MKFALVFGVVLAIIAAAAFIMIRVRQGHDVPLNLAARRERERNDEIIEAVAELYRTLENKYRLYDKYKNKPGYSTRWSEMIASIDKYCKEWLLENQHLRMNLPKDFTVKVAFYHNGNITFTVPKEISGYVRTCARRNMINSKQLSGVSA